MEIRKELIKNCLRCFVRQEFFMAVGAFLKSITPQDIGVNKYFFYKLDKKLKLDIYSDNRKGHSDKFLIKTGSKNTIPKLIKCSQTSTPIVAKQIFEMFLNVNGELWYAERNSEIAGYGWIFKKSYLLPIEGGYSDTVIRVSLKENEVFLGSVYVNEKYRRQGVFHRILYCISKKYDNYVVYSSAGAMNDVSKKAHFKLSFKFIGSFTYLRIYKFTYGILSFSFFNRKLLKLKRNVNSIGRIQDK